MKKTHIWVLTSILFIGNVMFSQENDPNNKEFLNDGRISNAKNVFKVNLASPIFGEFSVFYEGAITSNFSIELGVGKVFDYLKPEFDAVFFWMEDESYDFEINGGYSIWVNPRIYLSNRYTDGPYIGLIYRNRFVTINKDNEKISLFDYSINGGSQIFLINKLFLDLNLGLGYHFTKNKKRGLEITGISVPVSLKIGYFI